MTTSAQQLNFILSKVLSTNRPKERFLTVAADALDISGDDRELIILNRLFELVSLTEKEIELLGYDESLKKQLRNYLNPFKGLKSFAHVHLTLDGAKSNFLRPENVVNLTNIHFALDGKYEQSKLDFDTTEFVDRFRALKKDLLSSGLPTEILQNVARRLDHIISMLEHAHFFGTQNLKLETEALVGAIVLNAPKSEGKQSEFWGKTATAARFLLAALGWSDSVAEKVVSLAESGKKLISYLPDNDDSNPPSVE
ncbi:hypothetical protein [Maliponia aquimaris]|uniref:Uncharacterized protein n=1 Tax=Maliponia aquimaris TaxID=1673631 RepID=A0A238KL13_9RHOB|nr:hypothetical protein [Maliponia aquimaris]SMX43307.1 hypothetical protein MAA8898_02793 [Maliponia aquimaris]